MPTTGSSSVDPLPEKGLEELESRMAFLDHLVEQLNEVVSRQDRELLDLKRRLANTETRLKDLGESMAAQGSGGGDEIPPHY